MKRLKKLWDKKYPTFSHLTENHLRQKATFVEKKQREREAIPLANTNEQITNTQVETIEIVDIAEQEIPTTINHIQRTRTKIH